MVEEAGGNARVNILGVDVNGVTLEEATRRIEGFWKSPKRGRLVVTVNPELIMAALEQAEFAQALASSALVVPDGIGVVWASRVLGNPLPERVPGIELAERAMQSAARTGRKVYFLGGRSGVAEQAAEVLTKKYPGLKVSGVRDGFFPDYHSEIIADEIGALGVDLLLVGMGAPKQELWMTRHAERLNAKVMMGVGGAFDVYSGRVQRAPVAWQRLGLEWAYRLVKDPKRAPRMLALPRFVAAVLRAKWRL